MLKFKTKQEPFNRGWSAVVFDDTMDPEHQALAMTGVFKTEIEASRAGQLYVEALQSQGIESRKQDMKR